MIQSAECSDLHGAAADAVAGVGQNVVMKEWVCQSMKKMGMMYHTYYGQLLSTTEQCPKC